jgi:magnesium-transporting ATPase (P-type)
MNKGNSATNGKGQIQAAWHAQSKAEVLAQLSAEEGGLSAARAEARLAEYGRNTLPRRPPPTVWQILLRQFQSPLIYILLAAAAVAVLSGDLKDAGFIAAVLAINAGIGGYQEWRAEQSSRALQQLLHIRASVERDGEVVEIDAEEVVPGDIVWLESGQRVPADLRLFWAHGLETDESLLTGESMPVTKDAAWTGDEQTPTADRLNMAYAASIVVRGRGQGVCVATGVSTAVGQLALDVLGAIGGKPPLIERMERFARTVAYVVVAAVAVVSLLGIVIHGHSIRQMFLFGVALAVSAIPEGLPAALTVALAVATTRMARRGVIVRRLAAVEGLGSCTLIASDKTGTLTCNELTVREVHLPDGGVLTATGEGFAPRGEVRLGDDQVQAADRADLARLVRAGALCNEADLHQHNGAWVWRGDPTDVALLAFAHKVGVVREPLLDKYPQVNEIPFEPEHRFAATFHSLEGNTWAFVKGAPERVLGMCTIDEVDRARWLDEADDLAQRGMRVLAIADGAADHVTAEQTPPEPAGLQFLGFVGMIDPLRPGAREAIDACRQAGINVCMVTGDHPVTALAISRELGLAESPDQVVAGRDLDEKSPEELRETIRRGRVFARVTPRQKLELVRAARQEGHFVAVTGDGVNDAPALRTANIGVAMGKAGTDVAREAAGLVISDDNFATIAAGIEEGRVAYDNVRKVIFLLISAGATEVLVIGAALAVGPPLPLPLLPVQLLWLNLVTDGIQGVALAFEPGEAGILRRKPRPPREPIFNRLMIERTLVAAITMAIVSMAAFSWMIGAGWSDAAARNALLLLLVLFENIHIGNCRSEYQSALAVSPLRSPFLLFGALAAFLVHLFAMYFPPLQAVLGTAPVSLATWSTLLALALTIFVAMELHKWSWRRRYGGNA